MSNLSDLYVFFSYMIMLGMLAEVVFNYKGKHYFSSVFTILICAVIAPISMPIYLGMSIKNKL